MYLVEIDRAYRKKDYTIGRLSCDHNFVCNTLEDTDRDLDKDGKFSNGEVKIYGETAIPNGTYGIEFRMSSKFSSKFNNRPMPYITGCSTHTGVMIHWGNTAKDTLGCILVGENKEKGKVLNSRSTFSNLYFMLWEHRYELLLKIY